MSTTPVPPRGGKKRPRPSNGAGPSANRNGGSRQPQRRPSTRSAEIARRRRNRYLGIASVAVVVVVVVVLVVVKLSSSSGGSNTVPTTGTADSAVSPVQGVKAPAGLLAKLRSLPLSTIAAAPTTGLTPPTTIKDAALTSNGKPELLYIGAEYCPYCAAERWVMYVALSKFGTFSKDPGQIHSGVKDGDLQTLTFYGTTYTSKYFSFVPREIYTNKAGDGFYVPLDTLTKAQTALWEKHTGNPGSFPFIDFGGKSEITTSQYTDTQLSGQSFTDIASQIGDNTTPTGKDIDGSVKVFIQTLCSSLTGDKPASVCRAVGS